MRGVYTVTGFFGEGEDAHKNMEIARYGYEVVARTLRIALDRIKADADLAPAVARVAGFFGGLRDAGVFGSLQFARGFVRVRGALADITLDAPHAAKHLAAIEDECARLGVLERVAQGPPA